MTEHVYAGFRAYPEAERWAFTEQEIVAILTRHIQQNLGGMDFDATRYGALRFGPGGNNFDGPLFCLWRQYTPTRDDVTRWAEGIAKQGAL